MFNLMTKKAKNEKIAKEMIFKKIFNSANHKKMVKNAARKSSEDQEMLIKKYNKLVSGC